MIPTHFYKKALLANGSGHFAEPLKRGRLGNETVGSIIVRRFDVIPGVGGSQDHNRNMPKLVVAFDLAQCFPTVFAGHIQIQQDQLGHGMHGSCIAAPVVKKIQQVFAVFGKRNPAFGVVPLKGFTGKVAIILVIINQQSVNGFRLSLVGHNLELIRLRAAEPQK